MDREEAVNCMTYFWQEKGDLDRCASFDEAIVHFPDLKRAWDDYKRAERTVRIEVELL